MWIFCLLCAVPAILFIFRTLCLRIYKKHKNVCIVVLGDLGRSPRMQYHAISFAKEGFTVDFIGYPGSLPLREIRENPCIRTYYLVPPPKLEDCTYMVLLYNYTSINSLKLNHVFLLHMFSFVTLDYKAILTFAL